VVGDHAQLAAVDAGGAFGLLARTGTPAELRSLWRFRHRWEAHATRRLRRGDPAVLDTYAAHGRLHGGPAEAMLEHAYTAWAADTQAGRSSILIAADNHTVGALNQRVHTDRVACGLVTGRTVPLGAPGCGADRGQVGVGDGILTRNNDRTLHVPGAGHVRNGMLWTVTAVHDDGSLTVTPHPRTDRKGVPAAGVRLPAAYVAEHVDLGYATTAHRAQGITVDCCHVLAAPGMSREAFYVAMTRGRHPNTAYVTTDPTDPICDSVDTRSTPRPIRDVLTGILADTRAETSATETRTGATDAARSLHRLAPIRETIASIIDRAAGQPSSGRPGSATPRSTRSAPPPPPGRCSPRSAAARDSATPCTTSPPNSKPTRTKSPSAMSPPCSTTASKPGSPAHPTSPAKPAPRQTFLA
jgi:AAA domain